MRVIRHQGIEVRITEKDFKSLLRRFRPEPNKIPCVFCRRHHENASCGSCPFDQFKVNAGVGCFQLLGSSLGISHFGPMVQDGILVFDDEDRVVINKIREALLSLPKER